MERDGLCMTVCGICPLPFHFVGFSSEAHWQALATVSCRCVDLVRMSSMLVVQAPCWPLATGTVLTMYTMVHIYGTILSDIHETQRPVDV